MNGKILCMNLDGSVPADNLFLGSCVWLFGYCNVQGLVWDCLGWLWVIEFG